MTITTEQAVYQYQSRDGTWNYFLNESHYKNTKEDWRWPIRELFTRQQVIEQLAQASGVMPRELNDPDGGPFCWADEVREAIATMQARVELEEKTRKLLAHENGKLFEKLEQSKARVVELEKDAARYNNWKPWLEDTLESSLDAYEANDFALVKAAMNKESGK